MENKNYYDQKDEITNLYSKYRNILMSCKTDRDFLEQCTKIYFDMDSINIKNGFWNSIKGIDSEAVYYTAEFAKKVNQSLIESILKNQEIDEKNAITSTDKEEKEVILFSSLLYDYIANRKRITFHVIEPHPDDALGSASGICYNDNIFTILHTITISNDIRDSVSLDNNGIKNYKTIKKQPNIIKHEKYMLPDLHYDDRIIDETILYEDKITVYEKKYSHIDKLYKIIKDIVVEAKNTHTYIAIPLGLEHPMHILTSIIGIKCINELQFPFEHLLIYVDHPYDYELIGTDRNAEVRKFLESEKCINRKLLRCDDLGVKQGYLEPIINEIYGEKHYGEFAGTISKTYCSYYLLESAYENFSNYFNLRYNRILFISAQAWPFFKTGGLGEVAYSYCKSLQSSVDDVRILIPAIDTAYNNSELSKTCSGSNEISFYYIQNDKKYHCVIQEKIYDGLIYYIFNIWDYSGNRIEFTQPEKSGIEFAIFCDAIMQGGLNALDYIPTICHCNDWQTGLIPFLKKTKYHYYRKDLKIIYTIHFYGYKGIYSKKEILSLLGLNKDKCKLCISCNDECVFEKTELLNPLAKAELVQTPPSLMSFMRSGIEFADAVTTVSNGYAEELQNYPDFNNIKVIGIRNGTLPLSKRLKNISNDRCNIKNNLSELKLDELISYKKESKKYIQQLLGLNNNPDIPLISMVSRLAVEKGIDQIKTILSFVLNEGSQIIIVGDDADMDRHPYMDFFVDMEKLYKGQFAYRKYNESLEYLTYSASDILLMPSLSEACGTTQMVAMQHGVVPIVSMLASFRDTVLDFKNLDERSCKYWEKGVGFYAYKDDCWVLLEVIKKAIEVYKYDKDTWYKTMNYCYKTDFSWKNDSIYKYLQLFNKL